MSRAFIAPPRANPLLRGIVHIVERGMGHRLLPARLLAWYPKALVGAGAMEGLIAHGRSPAEKRLLHLVRLTASITAACPFCVDMNGRTWTEHGVTADEIAVMQGLSDDAASLTDPERIAIRYAKAISTTPLAFPPDLVADLRATFDERTMVMLASTAAQVNYWARLIQALGIPPAGFSDSCPLPDPAGQV